MWRARACPGSASCALAADFPGKVLEVRGRGFLVGVQMASDSAPTLAALREKGLLTAPAGEQRRAPASAAERLADELARSVEIFRKSWRAA